MLEKLYIPLLLLLAVAIAPSCRDGDSTASLNSGGSSSQSAGGTATGGGTSQAGSGAVNAGAPPTGGFAAMSRGGAAGAEGGSGGDGRSEGGGGTAGASPGGAPNTGGAPNATCSLDVAGLRVLSTWDDLGYPGYALDDCRLVYVGDDGALRLRSLDVKEEVELEPATNRPRRPVLEGDALAWEVLLDGKPQVRVWTADGVKTLSGDFHHAGEPAATDGAIAFTAFKAAGLAADSDIFVYEIRSGAQREIFGGTGQQRFAAISKTHIAAADFSEDPRGYFDDAGSLSDIIVRPREGGAAATRHRDGKQAFPMLSDDGTLAYLDWGAVHPEPKFSAFRLYVARPEAPVSDDVELRAIETDPSYVRPSLRNGIIDFVDRSAGRPLLYRQSLQSPDAAQVVDFGSSVVPLGPIARRTFTLIATRGIDGAQLRLVER